MQIASKAPVQSLLEQIEQSKKKPEAKVDAEKVEVTAVPAAVPAPLPKPHVWGTKSWASVLSQQPETSATESGAVSEDTIVQEGAAPESNQPENQVAEEDAEEGDSDEEGEEEESSSDEEEEGEGDEEEEGEDVQPVDAGVDHFTGEVQEVATALAGASLEDSTAAVEVREVEEEHIVSGFNEGDCGCGDADHHHEAHAAGEVSTAAPASVGAPAKVSQSSAEPYHTRMMRPSGLASGNNAESQRLRLEDDGKGWINSTNIVQQKGRSGLSFGSSAARKAHKPKSTGAEDGSVATSAAPTDETRSVSVSAAGTATTTATKKKKPKKRPVKVACLTTDFAMQNVMLQMDLRVMSVDGLMIKSARQWVMRCAGCFEVHYEMDRMFCRKCGGHQLSRVAASVDAGGKLKLHLRKNYHVDLRGTQYSLPAPGKQGRYQGEILLREDQLLQGIWKQKCVKIRKDIKSAFGEDVTADVGMHINKGQSIKIGLGKQNPNAMKGRERRGKAKKNTAK